MSYLLSLQTQKNKIKFSIVQWQTIQVLYFHFVCRLYGVKQHKEFVQNITGFIFKLFKRRIAKEKQEGGDGKI